MKQLFVTILLSFITFFSYGSDSYWDTIEHYQGVVDKDNVWMATSYGLVQYNKFSGEVKVHSTPTFTRIMALTFSKKEELIVGGGYATGLATFDGSDFIPLECEDLGYNPEFIAVLKDHNGLWIGNGRGLIHPSGSEWVEYNSPDPWCAAYIYKTLAWSEIGQQMWFGAFSTTTLGRKLGYVDADGITYISEATANIYGMLVQDDGSLLLASEIGLQKYSEKGIETIETPYNQPYFVATAIARQDSVIWLGSGKSLIRYDGKEFKDYEWVNDIDKFDQLNCIIPDEDGSLWVIFRYGGLTRFADGVFTYITSGVPSIKPDFKSNDNVIYDIRGIRLKNTPKNQILIKNGKKFMNTSSAQ